MDSNSGTLGRRGLKTSGMRRQRSLEWRQERGYSSSEEDIQTRPLDSHVFASLLAQAQQEFSSVDRSYRSDDTEDAVTTDNPTTPFPTPPPTLVSPRSPIPLHRQASPFPLENTNTRRIHYATPQDRIRGNNGEVIYASSKKTLSNSTLGRSGRGRHRAGGMTSSSSATSCNSCNDGRMAPTGNADLTYHDQQQRLCLSNDVNEESPPEPAPPEVPPRGPSLHSTTLRRRTEFADGNSSNNQQQESQFLSQGEYVLSGSPRTSGYPARSPMSAPTQHRINTGEKSDTYRFDVSFPKLAIRGDFSLRVGPFADTGKFFIDVGSLIDQIIRSNKQEFLQIALPFVERKVSEVFLSLANQISDGIDYDQVFPL